MTDLATRLRELGPDLVRCALDTLRPGDALRAGVEAEAARFFERLAGAVADDSPQGLHALMEGWAQSQPLAAGLEGETLAPALQALRMCTWTLLGQVLPAPEFLPAVLRLEPLFASAASRLSALELEARLADMQAELNAARAQLELLDKSKSDFIAVAAHELKTPLTLIEGYAQLMEAELPADQHPRVRVLLTGMRNGTRRLQEIIGDMIDVSLIDNQLLALDYTPVNLRVLIGGLAQDLASTLEHRRLRLDLDRLDRSVITQADPVRLRQVLLNLLENAVKYTPDGGLIQVRTRLLPGFVDLMVSDTGIGIALEDQQRIFDRFSPLGDVSLHSSSKTKFKGGGPGLGLSIARGIIQAHGGALWVESPGYDEQRCPGSTFHVMLPLRDMPPEASEPELLTWAKDPRPWRGLR